MNNNWKMCSEEMPKEKEWVLTCSKSGKIEIRFLDVQTIHIDNSFLFADVYNGKEFDEKDFSFENGRKDAESGRSAINSPMLWLYSDWNSDPVIAWIPLPEPAQV